MLSSWCFISCSLNESGMMRIRDDLCWGAGGREDTESKQSRSYGKFQRRFTGSCRRNMESRQGHWQSRLYSLRSKRWAKWWELKDTQSETWPRRRNATMQVQKGQCWPCWVPLGASRKGQAVSEQPILMPISCSDWNSNVLLDWFIVLEGVFSPGEVRKARLWLGLA